MAGGPVAMGTIPAFRAVPAPMDRAHPDQRTARDPEQRRVAGAGSALPTGTGLAEGDKAQVILLLSNLVRSDVALNVDLAEAAQASGSTAQQGAAGYGRLLTKLIDTGRFPALADAVAAGTFDDDPDADFVFGLERILDGIEVLVRAQA